MRRKFSKVKGTSWVNGPEAKDCGIMKRSDSVLPRRWRLGLVIALPVVAVLAANACGATTYYWDAGGTPSQTGGGNGTWDTSTANWDVGGTNVAWVNGSGSYANFIANSTTLGYTVTMASGASITAGSLTFTPTSDAYGFTIDAPSTSGTTASLDIGTLYVSTHGGTVTFGPGSGGGTLDVTIGTLDNTGDLTAGIQVLGPKVTVDMTGSNNGTTTVDGGTLNVSATDEFGSSLNFRAGTINALTNMISSVKIGELAGTITLGGGHSLEFTNSNAAPTDNNAPVSTVADVLANTLIQWDGSENDNATSTQGAAATLEKSGLGTLILTGNYYSGGATTVAAGTLEVDGSFAVNAESGHASAFTVESAATLQGTGSIAGTTTVDSGGILAPGTVVASAGHSSGTTLSLAGGATLDSGSVLDFTLGSASDLISTAALTLSQNITINIMQGSGFGSGIYKLIGYTSLTDNSAGFSGWTINGLSGLNYSLSNNTSTNSIDLTVAPIPEPTAIGLLGVGGMALLLVGRRRKMA